MRAILPALLTVALIVIILTIVTGIPLGIGWILTLFLPFSLFEGTLLGMIASLVTGFIWYRIVSSWSEEEENDAEADEIPESRFWRTTAERTWENWFRHQIANAIHEYLLDLSAWMEDMGEKELQESSIRLADAALEVLKAKLPRATRLRVSKGRLKHEMIKMGHPSYEDGILNTATEAVNTVLAYSDQVLKRVIREQLWDEPAGIT